MCIIGVSSTLGISEATTWIRTKVNKPTQNLSERLPRFHTQQGLASRMNYRKLMN